MNNVTKLPWRRDFAHMSPANRAKKGPPLRGAAPFETSIEPRWP